MSLNQGGKLAIFAADSTNRLLLLQLLQKSFLRGTLDPNSEQLNSFDRSQRMDYRLYKNSRSRLSTHLDIQVPRVSLVDRCGFMTTSRYMCSFSSVRIIQKTRHSLTVRCLRACSLAPETNSMSESLAVSYRSFGEATSDTNQCRRTIFSRSHALPRFK